MLLQFAPAGPSSACLWAFLPSLLSPPFFSPSPSPLFYVALPFLFLFFSIFSFLSFFLSSFSSPPPSLVAFPLARFSSPFSPPPYSPSLTCSFSILPLFSVSSASLMALLLVSLAPLCSMLCSGGLVPLTVGGQALPPARPCAAALGTPWWG